MLCCFILIFPCAAIFRTFKENTVVQVYDLHGWMLCSCRAKSISVLVGLMPTNDREWHYGIFSVRLAFHQRAFFTRPVTYIFGWNTKDGLSQLLLPEHICWKSYSNRASTWREIATSKSHDPAINISKDSFCLQTLRNFAGKERPAAKESQTSYQCCQDVTKKARGGFASAAAWVGFEALRSKVSWGGSGSPSDKVGWCHVMPGCTSGVYKELPASF